jgi:tetratricopeptide (TPR) repeat protein
MTADVPQSERRVSVAPARGAPTPYAPYPPSLNVPENYTATLDFDANKIADARLIRTFPLAQPAMNALEIEFRGGMDLFSKKRFAEAYESFTHQAWAYGGNYLSPYWAGVCALKLGDRDNAIAWYNNALGINPYYEPARNAMLNALNNEKPQPKQTAKKTSKAKKRRSK